MCEVQVHVRFGEPFVGTVRVELVDPRLEERQLVLDFLHLDLGLSWTFKIQLLILQSDEFLLNCDQG